MIRFWRRFKRHFKDFWHNIFDEKTDYHYCQCCHRWYPIQRMAELGENGLCLGCDDLKCETDLDYSDNGGYNEEIH